MNKLCNKNTRMSIDIDSKEHKKIKMFSAKSGVSIRKFVIDCIHAKMIPDDTKKVRP